MSILQTIPLKDINYKNFELIGCLYCRNKADYEIRFMNHDGGYVKISSCKECLKRLQNEFLQIKL